MTNTFVDKLSSAASVNSRAEATHPFLKLVQPDLDPVADLHHIPAGTTATFPFTFVVPAFLLSCRHTVASPTVRTAHSALPPSLGDPDLAGSGPALLDDLAPAMARISYAVTVRLSNDGPLGDKPTILATRSRKVRILPSVPEAPPVEPSQDDESHCLRREKTIRKSLISGRKTGRLAICTLSPSSFRLPHIADTSPTTQADTLATLRLRFDPHTAEARPPRLGDLTSKLRVVTFFACAARQQLPTKSSCLYDSAQGSFHETLPLLSRCMKGVQWVRHEPSGSAPASPSQPALSPRKEMQQSLFSRRDSGISVSSLTAAADFEDIVPPTKSFKPALPFYTADILVPTRLPANKAWIPTFHSCLVSRVYALELSIAVDAPGMGSSTTLRVPVQISSVGSARVPDASRVVDLELAAVASIEGYFAPRRSVIEAYDEATLAMDPDAEVVQSRAGVDAAALPDSPPVYTPLPAREQRRQGSAGTLTSFTHAVRDLCAVGTLVR